MADDATCPACKGLGSMGVFVDGPSGGYFRPVEECSICLGAGRISATRADWFAAGRAHYKARVARRETVMSCAQRLGLGLAELSGMEHGRIDPERIRLAAVSPEGV